MQTLAYNVFDPTACAFPAPRVPLLPTLSLQGLGRASREFAVVGEGRAARSYTRGRYALAAAYRLAGVGPDASLLAPAYHCRTMLDPALRLGAPVLLYRLDERLAPDLTALQWQLKTARTRVGALLLTHYFGFPQAASALRQFCEAHGIALIEDCSHALLDRRGAGQLGRHGLYTTASPYKFFPCEEGGLLIARDGAPLPAVRRAGLRAELRTLAHAAEHARTHRRTGRRRADIDRLDAQLQDLVKGPLERGTQARRTLCGTSAAYAAAEEGRAATRASRALMALCDVDHAAARRRANYARWVEAMRGVPNCRALFERLPDGVVPYMFPLFIEHPNDHFAVLKQLGVPIWRWDDMADSSCAVSQRCREHLLHLPCHQALSATELDWMTRAVERTLRLGAKALDATHRMTGSTP